MVFNLHWSHPSLPSLVVALRITTTFLVQVLGPKVAEMNIIYKELCLCVLTYVLVLWSTSEWLVLVYLRTLPVLRQLLRWHLSKAFTGKCVSHCCVGQQITVVENNRLTKMLLKKKKLRKEILRLLRVLKSSNIFLGNQKAMNTSTHAQERPENALSFSLRLALRLCANKKWSLRQSSKLPSCVSCSVVHVLKPGNCLKTVS